MERSAISVAGSQSCESWPAGAPLSCAAVHPSRCSAGCSWPAAQRWSVFAVSSGAGPPVERSALCEASPPKTTHAPAAQGETRWQQITTAAIKRNRKWHKKRKGLWAWLQLSDREKDTTGNCRNEPQQVQWHRSCLPVRLPLPDALVFALFPVLPLLGPSLPHMLL